MDKIRKCTVCGREFISRHGKTVCSDNCVMERKREQDRAANHRRYKGISNQPTSRECKQCGKTFDGFGPMKYCSEECRESARKENIKLNNTLYYSLKKEKKNGHEHIN